MILLSTRLVIRPFGRIYSTTTTYTASVAGGADICPNDRFLESTKDVFNDLIDVEKNNLT